MIYFFTIFSLSVSLLQLTSIVQGRPELEKNCLIAYDVGSTTTRAEFAQKRKEGWEIQSSDMAWISTFHMDEMSVKEAFEKFKRFRKHTLDKTPKDCKITERGIGTAGLRGSGEWGLLFEQWLQDLGIDFRMITQEEESLLGLKAAKFRLGNDTPQEHFCIWDIGGGSAQLLCEEDGEHTVAGSEISVRNVVLLWDASHCTSNETIADELSCKLHNLFSKIDQEETFAHNEFTLQLFPIESLNAIKSIVHRNHLIFGVGPVHQYFGLESLKLQGLLEHETDYEFEHLDHLLRLRFTENNESSLLKLLPIYITLVLLDKPVVRVVPEVNNALGLIY